MTPLDLAQAIRTAPNDDAAVALARQSRAAEISAGLRRLAKQAQPVTAEAWESVATAIDNGRL